MQWLQDALKNIIQLFKDIYSAVEQWFQDMLLFFWDMMDYCLFMVWEFCYYLYDLFLGEEGFIWYPFDFLLIFSDEFVEIFPDLGGIVSDDGGAFSYTMHLAGRFNQFFPVVESFYLLNIYLVFLTVYILIKLLLKVIPGLGG
jgi:hypothetical protein